MKSLVSSACPLRLIAAPTGLYAQWGMAARCRVSESFPVFLEHEHSLALVQGFNASSWVAPPGMKRPASMSTCDMGLDWNALTHEQLQAAWWWALRHRFGDGVFKLGLRIFVRGLNLWRLSQVAAYYSVLEQRLQEHHQLGPLLACDVGMWSELPNWKVVKARYLALGLESATWRWLCRQGGAYIASLDWSSSTHLAWVNLHAALGEVISVQSLDRQTGALQGFGGLTGWLRRNPPPWNGEATQSLLRGLRLCMGRLKSVEGRSNQLELIQEEFPLIADWMLARVLGDAPLPVRIQRGWTYDTLMSWQSRWHLSDFGSAASDSDLFWPELLGVGHLENGYSFMELSSLKALLQEAKRMHHCVPSYISRCLDGQIGLFHVYRAGAQNERATLELGRRGASAWVIQQLKGPCNAAVSEGMWSAARQLASRLSPA